MLFQHFVKNVSFIVRVKVFTPNIRLLLLMATKNALNILWTRSTQ